MMNNCQEEYINIFKYNLRKDARTISVATLMSPRYIKRIKYDPYYQRNYVWEKDKQSFFIESILLGTEIPPIILYKSGLNVEVIDGRQRFETIKRFREDDFALHANGLLELQALDGKKYSTLKPEFRQLFDDTKIRVFEFEIVGMTDCSVSIEDKVKKEIFRRYNSGITPLTQSEVDNAKYDEDDLTGVLKSRLKDSATYQLIKDCLFKNNNKDQKELIVDIVSLLRRYLVLTRIPIVRYADSGKTLLIELFYDHFVNECNENELSLSTIVDDLIDEIKSIFEVTMSNCATIYESLVWALRVLKENQVKFDISLFSKEIKSHYDEVLNTLYQTANDHYYGTIVSRFTDTADLITKLTGFDFSPYLRNSGFSGQMKTLLQTEEDAELTLEKLKILRINKPDPASKPIDQLLTEVSQDKYLIRPSYQRQEKINQVKASSIIESILLGIKLPPLFIFVRKDGIREVIDGQQRILSILGFLGRSYRNEDGELVTSNNNCFKLKNMRILTDYNGKRFSAIQRDVEDTILDFDIDEVEIFEEHNPKFVPTDLFIRLNSKPYPIRANTFEMWNSVSDRDVIEKIKDITKRYNSWFYITTPKMDESGNPRDRMQNEELITILSYLCYYSLKNQLIEKTLGFYHVQSKLVCRLKSKESLTNLLVNLDSKPVEKEEFLCAIDKTESIINLIQEVLLGGSPDKESFNSLMNVKKLLRYSRSYQEFYVLWILLMKADREELKSKELEFKKELSGIFHMLKNTAEIVVDDSYVEHFMSEIERVSGKYTVKTPIGFQAMQ